MYVYIYIYMCVCVCACRILSHNPRQQGTKRAAMQMANLIEGCASAGTGTVCPPATHVSQIASFIMCVWDS